MESVVTIAIPDLSGSAACTATLQSLARHTPEPYKVVLLVEERSGHPDLPQQNDQAIRRIALPAPFSMPAGLNRLLKVCSTSYILLLESGAIVTVGWLGRLLAPLNDLAVGLSGPSTNSSWNEQKVLTGSDGFGWNVRQIDVYAATVARRYQGQWRSLDTLHSLGDFCYLFKRAVAEQLGGFDEAYGPGPCWEIDFTTRAARAGFRATWVADAYVHRAPPSRWKATSVQHHFTNSKQLYQDRFCGLRLEGKKADYEYHCRGEACEHFAPPNLIQITLPSKPKKEEASPGVPSTPRTSETLAIALPASKGETELVGAMPLISCIMPTRNRRAFIGQALSYFMRQDYANRELIIVDDGEDRIADLLPADPRIHYIALSRAVSIGEKRNIACDRAHGDIIAHWDDDDWYAPHRLSYQAAPLLAKEADITGLETSCFFDLPQWQAWTCTPELHRRLFVGNVHGGTLVYRRSIWQSIARYPARSLAEDALFLRQACQRGAQLRKLPHACSFVYIRHTGNAWSFPLGSYLQPDSWKHADVKTFLPAGDLPFYLALSSSNPTRTDTSNSSHQNQGYPLVSCIMPTYNRRLFVPQAIQYFLRLDYPNCELIIVDDGSEPVDDIILADERIRYIRLRAKTTVDAKRNIACEEARGAIIAHWDDDDWHASYRLHYQVQALLREDAQVCGICVPLFYDMERGQAWQYVYPNNQRSWLSGSTLCYKRTFWTHHRFANINVGEDGRFVWNNHRERMATLEDVTFHVGIIHQQNVSPKNTSGTYWQPYPVDEIHCLFGQDWHFYQPH